MKKALLFLFVLCSSLSIAQENFPALETTSGFDVGFQLSEYAGNFGLGLTLSSPRILKENMQIRLRVQQMYLAYTTNDETLWGQYSNLMLGLSSATAKLSKSVGLYGEGGVVVLLPQNALSSADYEIGGFGIFGFEFYFADSFTYFIELGGIGSDGVAENVENKPRYGSGFTSSVGFKLKF